MIEQLKLEYQKNQNILGNYNKLIQQLKHEDVPDKKKKIDFKRC